MGTVFSTATRTGDRIAQLDGTGRKYSYVLNDPGTAEITVPLDRYQRYQVDPGAVELHVHRDGALVWAGPVWGARADTGSGALTITAAGLESYFEGQRNKDNEGFVDIDQAIIWRTLLANEVMRDPEWNLTVPAAGTSEIPLTGVTRTFTDEDGWYGYQRFDVAQKAEELASLPFGFDWDVKPDRTARLYYPRQGVDADQVLELGRNLDHIEVEVNARTVETVVDVFGSGDGTATPIGIVEAPEEILRYGHRHGVATDQTVTNQEILRAKADARLAKRARASEVPRLVMLPGVEPILGQVGKGDMVEVRASRGWVQMMGTYRIVAIEVSVDDSGVEQVSYIPEDPTAVESDVA